MERRHNPLSRRQAIELPFDSLESALEFTILLHSVATEAAEDLRRKLEQDGTERYRSGLNLALYKVTQLNFHLEKSRRLLNDLVRIRAVLLETNMVDPEESNLRRSN
jgi:hypothetical protein